jgi:hypothetical protein
VEQTCDAGPRLTVLATVLDAIGFAALATRDPLEVLGAARLPLEAGEVWAHAVRAWDGNEHLVLTPGRDLVPGPVSTVSACLVGQVFRSSACGCRRSYDDAVRRLVCAGSGAVVFLRTAPSGQPCDRAAGPDRSSYERALVAQMVDAVARSSDRLLEPAPTLGVGA